MDPDLATSVFAWVAAHGGEVAVGVVLVSVGLAHLAKLTPWNWDDVWAERLGVVGRAVAKMYGRTPPEEPKE